MKSYVFSLLLSLFTFFLGGVYSTKKTIKGECANGKCTAAVNSKMTASAMKVRKEIVARNIARFATFDDGDLDGTMEMFLRSEEALFNLEYPHAKTEAMSFKGFENIKAMEGGFMKAIAENFGSAYHEVVEWKWDSITDSTADVSVYLRLWLTDKTTGEWSQKDLSGKTGRFWMDMHHVKVGDKWFLKTLTARSEDED